MTLGTFEHLLRDAIGLDVASIGQSSIERAVKDRQKACALPNRDAYRDHVSCSTTELQELIEAVIVPETWFFRDREAFAALGQDVATEWLASHPEGMLRLLSLPCATGEEPYSMAMALLDAGLPASRFRIDGIDISGRVLVQARTGIYGRRSFRGAELAFRGRHFKAAAQEHQIDDVVRRQVRFLHGNLLSPALLSDGDAYDIIFCRNLLIYFDRQTQARAIAALSMRLAPQGYLFVGPSETGVLPNHGFVSARLPMSFAFRKGAAVASRPPETAAMRSPAVARPPARSRAVPASAEARTAPSRPRRSESSAREIDEAQRLADQGHLVEAALACETHLRAHGPSAPAFYLLGLVRGAAGRLTDAEACYRKALYLDPQHSEALLHLALLMDAQGRQADALVLRQRVRRLESTSAG